MKQNGYFTTGAHPCYAWFYNRQNINKNLGFDEYLFSENYFADLTGKCSFGNGNRITDFCIKVCISRHADAAKNRLDFFVKKRRRFASGTMRADKSGNAGRVSNDIP